jgi:arylsulfatase A-like enzyme
MSGGENMNIVQIVSDTLRRDYIGCYGNDKVHTENLDRFAGESIVFDKAYVSSFPTIPHRRDLHTGRHTFTYSKWSFNGREPNLPWDEVILSESLSQAGYTTMFIADTPHLVRDRHGFDRGFDGWSWIRGQENDRGPWTNPTKESKELGDILGYHYLMNIQMRKFESDYFVAQTMQAAEKWLELNYDQHENFFLYIDTFDPHEPWDPPKWYADIYDPDWEGGPVSGMAYAPKRTTIASHLSEEELNHLRALYAGEVTLVDRWVGRVFQKIEDLGLYEDTAVVFTTDHGTYLGEHNAIGKNAVLYEETAHIPLIMKMPDSMGSVHGRCDALVQPPDLMPTFLEIAGAKIPDRVQGKSLLPLIQDEEKQIRDIAVSSGSLLTTFWITTTSPDWALIAVKKGAKKHLEDAVQQGLYRKEMNAPDTSELYNLKADPTQSRDAYKENPEVAETLHSKMVRFLESIGTREDLLKGWKTQPSPKG